MNTTLNWRSSFGLTGGRRGWGMVLLLAGVLQLTMAAAQAQYGIARQSASFMNIGDQNPSKDPTYRCNYAAYAITNNTGSAQADVWVTCDTFAGGVVSLGTYEDGVAHVGPMANGQVKMVYFYLMASAATTTPQTHYIRVHNGPPVGSPVTSQQFTIDSVIEEIRANANKPTGAVNSPNPPHIGGTVQITVTGDTGVLGDIQNLLFTPAADVNWPADSLELYSVQITFTGGNNVTITDQLHFTLPNPATSAYTAIYTFRIRNTTSAATPISPLGYIRSGKNNMKYELLQTIPNVDPPISLMTVSKSVDSASLANGGTVTYSLVLSNADTASATFDDFTDTLPTAPAAASYINNSTSTNGVAAPSFNPTAIGSTLKWVGTFVVPAGGKYTLSFQATLPSTQGFYTNSAVAHVSTAQIDTTADVTDNSPAKAVTLVGERADVSVTKSAPGTITAGGTLTYSIVVSNFGPSVATSLVVTDTLPNTATFSSATPAGYTQDGQKIIWSGLGSLTSGGTTNLSITVQVPTTGILSNYVTAGSSTTDDTPANNAFGPVTSTVSERADVSVTKSAAGSITAGGTLTYSIVVSNFGPSVATSLVVTDTLPDTATFSSATPAGYTQDGQKIIWGSLGNLAIGGSTNLAITIQVPSTGILSNYVSAGSSTTDETPGNNLYGPVTSVVNERADVSVTKSASGTITAGGTLTYSIVVSNFGPSVATSLVVTDTLPDTATFSSAIPAGYTQNGQKIIWSGLGNLAVGGATNLSITVQVPPTGILSNYVSAGSSTTDETPGNNTFGPVTSTVGERADVSVTKSAAGPITAGGTFTYSIVVSNFGPSVATSLVVTDTLPDTATFSSAIPAGYSQVGQKIIWSSLGSLTSGGATNLSITVQAPPSGILSNFVTAGSSVTDDTLANNSFGPVISAVGERADVSVTKSALGTATAGGTLTYSIVVSNLGPSAAISLVVTDTLPDTATFSAATPAGYAQDGQKIIWSGLGDLANGGATNLTITIQTPPTGILSNYVSAGSSTTDETPGNNTFGPVTNAVGERADLVATKQGPTGVAGGDSIWYTITVSNIGPSAATSVVVTDSLPQNVSFGSATGGVHVGNIITWSISSLASGAASNFPVNILAPGAGTLTNKVSAGSSTVDPQPANNNGTAPEASVITDIRPAPAPVINYYTTTNFTTVAIARPAGQPLYVQAVAPGCNLNADAIETNLITFVSKLTGDTETFLGIETSATSGVFRAYSGNPLVPWVPTDAVTSVPAPDTVGRIETMSGDEITATIAGCNSEPATTRIFIDPGGVVFNSLDNSPVAGATVTVYQAGTTIPAEVRDYDGTTVLPSFVITGGDGRYTFPVMTNGNYQLVVNPPASYTFPSTVATNDLPAGRTIVVPGSFGGAFTLTTEQPALEIDLPVDPVPVAGTLFIEKDVNHREAEIGDVVQYMVSIRYSGTGNLTNVVVNDLLPAGFNYLKGSAKLDGKALSNPDGGEGPHLLFHIGELKTDTVVKLTYRVRVGVGALQGTGKNRAQAYAPGPPAIASNISIVKVRVLPGVFTDKCIIIGKVFVDLNKNDIQDDGEPGIPGVRLYLEDGTYVITDSEGKYSLYDIEPRTHALKLDETTVPAGFKGSRLTQRHNGRGTLVLLDLKRHEIHKANFADVSGDKQLLDDVKRRRAQGEVNVAEITTAASTVSAAGNWLAGATPLANTTVAAPVGTAAPAVGPLYESVLVPRTLNAGNSNLPLTPVAAAPKLKLVLPAADQMADGQTPARISVELVDADGKPIRERTIVTLESSLGRWKAEDTDMKQDGVQVQIEGGRGEFELLPPQEPGTAVIVVSKGAALAEGRLAFLPALRPLIAAGLIETRFSFRQFDISKLTPARRDDGFEEELHNWAYSGGDDHQWRATGRAALYLKGAIKGDYLLTLAYDSEKETRDRLFRDINPDSLYPVYGDSSVRGFDAQSTGRLYVRVDKRKCYLLYGDYTTTTSVEARGLGQYSRSVTGPKLHLENERGFLNAWATYDTTRQVIDEFPADGTSGPFYFRKTDGLSNSEKVEVIVRDRNQQGVILSVTPLARFADYEFEPFSGRLLLRAPLPSLDANLNPVSIRVTFEIDQGGKKFWIVGADGQFKVSPMWEVGGSTVHDQAPGADYKLHSLNTTLQLSPTTYLFLEGASSDTDTNGVGYAGRVELRHASDRLNLRLYAAYVETNFDNTASIVTAGREELGFQAALKLSQQDRLTGTGIYSKDLATGGVLRGVTAAYEHTFDCKLTLAIGVRYSTETREPATDTGAGVTPLEFSTLMLRASGPIPGLPRMSAFAEYENDLTHTDRRAIGVGAKYQVDDRSRVYARHEFLDAMGTPFELNRSQEINRTVLGVESEYMKDGHLFNEYRMRDAGNGREAEAAIGLRNMWTIGDGLRLNTSFERVDPLTKTNNPAATTAIGLGWEYLREQDWKTTGRIENRWSEDDNHWFNTLGYARKLTDQWTMLARSILNYDDRQHGQGDLFQARLQLGAALRPTRTDEWNALFKYEFKYEDDDTALLLRRVHIFTTHVNWQPTAELTLSGRYAVKYVDDEDGQYDAHLVALRGTYDLTKRWSVGVNGCAMFSGKDEAVQFGVGPEIGFRFSDAGWFTVGYNVVGFYDRDLSDGNYTDQGLYFAVRMLFDEHLLDGLTKPAKR